MDKRESIDDNIPTVVKTGDPILHAQAKPITHFGTPELAELIELLFHTMAHYHGVGIAAPQLGEGKQIFVYGVENNIRYPEAPKIAHTFLINPELIYHSEEKNDSYEGCLSVPRLRGLISRANTITFKAYTFEGECYEKTVAGFEARIIQHEFDHLQGVLFPMRMHDMKTLKYTDN